MFERLKARLGGEEPSREWEASLRRGRAQTLDGTSIAYEVVGEGETTIVLANGLGGRLYAWLELIRPMHKRFKFITWDYRGLFESGSEHKRLAVVHQAEDVSSILKAEGVGKAVLVGWSMGVQVSLEFAGTHPDKVLGLVLINGTYGHTLSTGLQPLFPVPFLSKRLHAALEFFQKHPELTEHVTRAARLSELPTAALFALTAGPKILKHQKLFHQYFEDVLGPSFGNFLRLFQELDAHSAYHLLPTISAPTLIVSGFFDPLTPAYQSKEMARRMPNAEHLELFRAGHFALVERPEIVVPAVERFLRDRALRG